MGEQWPEKWRNSIRAGETAVVIGLWAGGIAASDNVIAAILLAAGVGVGLFAVGADPIRSRVAKVLLGLALIATFAGSLAIVNWRHQIDLAHQASQPRAPTGGGGLTAQQISDLIRATLRGQGGEPLANHKADSAHLSAASGASSDYRSSASTMAAAMRRAIARREALKACEKTRSDVSIQILWLTSHAEQTQDSFMRNFDDKAIIAAYLKWNNTALEFIKKNKAILPDTKPFYDSQKGGRGSKDRDHYLGYQAFGKFDAERMALSKLGASFEAGTQDCEAVANEAVK